MVQVARLSSDSVKLWDDDVQHLTVSRSDYNDWTVYKHRTGVTGSGRLLDSFTTAGEAIAFATDYLQGGRDELDKALKDFGLSQ